MKKLTALLLALLSLVGIHPQTQNSEDPPVEDGPRRTEGTGGDTR